MPEATVKAKKIGKKGRSLSLDIDPRIDLIEPIYEQVVRLSAKDKAAEARRRRLLRFAPPAPVPGQPLDPHVLIKGYGALEGQLELPDDIDWTQPIYEQVLARSRRSGGSKKSRTSAA